jgi:hypothetical protein
MFQFFDSVARSIGTNGGLLGGIFVVVWYLLVFAFLIFIYLPLYVIGWVVWWAWPVLLPAALITAALKWEFFLRLYYEFTPHPAASMVNDAIRAKVQFDAQAIADILEPATGPRVQQDVRNAQAMKLAEMARMSNEQLRRAADELQRQVAEQAQYQAAHGELLDAMVAQRVAKARADAFAKAEEFWKSRRKP